MIFTAADINGDGWQDIVTYNGDKLLRYDTSHSLAVTTVVQGIGNHEGGVAPRGAGDIDGDGDIDLAIGGKWFANPGNGVGEWFAHDWPYSSIPNATYGPSIRSWVVDLDGDGDNDIVYSDCDTGSSHVYWVRNEGGGTNWTKFQLTDPPTSLGSVPRTGSFHSLGVADFNGDGRLDIFAGEQEDPDDWGGVLLPMKPHGLKERGVIWINLGSNPPTFIPDVIQEDNPGWHDACIGDVDGDGDIDIVSKIWNKDGPTYHADYWRNDSVVRLDNGADLTGWHSSGGLWQVVGGAIVGQQNPPGSGNGGLLLSDQSYGDFEATFDVWPDWGVDSGFFTRTTDTGKAYQVTIDYQVNNPMGGVYLEGIGDTGSWDFTLTGKNSIHGAPKYFSLSDWPNIWNPAGWNTFRVIVTNNPPHIITWINGTRICDYQDTQIRLSSTGMIALQVHPTAAEWPNGAVTCFRNIGIKDLFHTFLAPPSDPPTVSLTLPTNGTVYEGPTNLTITAEASDSDGTINKVDFYAGSTLLGSRMAEPYSLVWGNVPTGNYNLTAKATDNSGAVTVSAPVSIVVNYSGAGPDLTGLALWLKADSGIATNGMNVSVWADQSGQGHDAVQGIATSQPTLATSGTGRPGVRFDGLNDYLTFHLPINGWRATTIFLMASTDLLVTNSVQAAGPGQESHTAICWPETADWGSTRLNPYSGDVYWRFGTTALNNNNHYVRPASIGAGYSLSTLVKNGSLETLYVDGLEAMQVSGKASILAGDADDGWLGKGNDPYSGGPTYFAGEILEVLVHSRALSNTERANVESYLEDCYIGSGRIELNVERSGDGMKFSWPVPAPVYELETSDHLTGSDWLPVGQKPTVTEDKFVVTLPMESTPRFFRLKKQ